MAIDNFDKIKGLPKFDSRENLFKRKPRLTDFYDELDPRGCSGREYDDYFEALDKWKQNKSVENLEIGKDYITDVNTNTFRIILPLEMIWQPKEDITPYEIAMCIPYFFRHREVMPCDVDNSLPHFRHFKITDRNVK